MQFGHESVPETKTAYKDGTGPTGVSLSIGTRTINSIPVTASATDATSGIATYRFDYKLSTASTWINGTEQASTSYTYTGLSSGQSYKLRVAVKDNAGNESITGEDSYQTSTVDNIPPTAPTINLSGTKSRRMVYNKCRINNNSRNR